MCLLDFMRISSNGTRQKKSTKELPNRNQSQLHHKFSDVNTIYFNENISMTSRCNTIRFSRCPTGNFKPNAMSNLKRPSRHQPVYEWIGGKGSTQNKTPSSISKSTKPVFPMNGNDKRKTSIASRQSPIFFDSSSDERILSTTDKSGISSLTESPVSDSSMRETETDDCLCSYSDCGQTIADAHSVAGLDSFCTLCTSSFSFNRCNQCEDSSCGSKCNLSQRKSGKKLLDQTGDTSGGGECSSTSGLISSDCDSVLYR